MGGSFVAAAPANKTLAQQLVEEAMAKHPQVSGVEFPALRPGRAARPSPQPTPKTWARSATKMNLRQ
jgi:hypothetical protein